MINSNTDLSWLWILLIVIACCFIFYFVIRYTLKHKVETITSYTGGLGSGKTLLSVDKALSLYRKNLRRWKRKKWLYHVLHIDQKFTDEEPILLSNIPIKIGKGKYCVRLKKEHLLLQERIPQKSVILLDEIGSFASQFDYNQKNVIVVFDEFVRFFRHYVNGYIVCNDQCSENINLVIRRRINKITNLSNCFVIFHLCFYYSRQINISEEIKTVDSSQGNKSNQNDTQDNMNFSFKFVFNKNAYDSRCYSVRYDSVPEAVNSSFDQKKTHDLLKCPRDKDSNEKPLTK